MCVLVCINVYTRGYNCMLFQERTLGLPGAGVTDSCKSPNLRTKIELQKQYSLLIVKPSPHILRIIIM